MLEQASVECKPRSTWLKQGIRYILLERSPAIGGTMAQLDKTFPTNDCAMCIMSPKLVEVGRHLNIDIMTTSEILEVNGEPGNFKVKIRQHPRYVDLLKCTGCGDCATACPVHRADLFNGGLSQRKAIYKTYPQAIPNAFAIEKSGVAPCRDACPINQRAQGYIALIREGRYADAYRTIKQDNPFPSICGRLCNHRCEDACSRNESDQPVNIMALKRFATDWALQHPEEITSLNLTTNQVEPSGKRVAIVGSGPAGLTCALDLVRQGHQVTVYEALPVAGGMMRVGVPECRIPYDLVQGEIDDILSEGVELILNRPIENIPSLLDDGYEAVFVAVGAHVGIKLPIPGVDLPQVFMATDFLRQTSLKNWDKIQPDIRGKRVLVLGGGNVAIDSALSAIRLGASWVGMSCLESRETMPAHDWEVRDASEEGVQVFPSRTFKEVTSQDNQVTGVRCVQVDFRGFIEGRPDFDEIPGTEEIIAADTVIFAIGQRPDIECLKEEIETVRGRFPKVNPETLATSHPRIFAGGDAVTGTSFIVNAIAAGHHAARSINQMLQGEAPGIAEARPPVVKLEASEINQRLTENASLQNEPL